MAVYTEVSDEDLKAFVADYDIGTVLSFKGIAEGVENTNYLMQTEQGQFILTLYEKRVLPQDLPYFLNLMEFLAEAGIPCPTPLACRRWQGTARTLRTARGHRNLLKRHVAKEDTRHTLRGTRYGARAPAYGRRRIRHVPAKWFDARSVATAL